MSHTTPLGALLKLTPLMLENLEEDDRPSVRVAVEEIEAQRAHVATLTAELEQLREANSNRIHECDELIGR